MIDSKRLLVDLQKQVRLLETDLAEQLTTMPGAAEMLRGEYDDERKARRTAAEWPAWRDAQLTQVAVAWVLGTVFLRWSEDNGLIDPVLSGPGHRLAVAEDAQLAHYRRHPEHNDGDWLAEQFEVLKSTDAGRLLFDEQHNPMYWVPISHDAAKALVAFWRSTDATGPRHDFSDPNWDTRFLGDLYQELSASSRDDYSLLQTAPFVEKYILNTTLDPAIAERGLDGIRVIDPACGSGHFLLAVFSRLVDAWRDSGRAIDDYELVRRVLDSVHGVDLNPFAVAITRFRLAVASWRALGISRVVDASKLNLRPLVACGDSLLPMTAQQNLFDHDMSAAQKLRAADVHRFSDVNILGRGSYDVVVANPPYHAVEDGNLRDTYRELYDSCFGKYTIAVPFAELLFRLMTPTGFVGQITSSSFMKRKFGKRLVESFFRGANLTHVIDTSGIPIPGAGVTTVILFGRGPDAPKRSTVRVLSRIAGEPGRAPGPAWRSIIDHTEGADAESEWISATNVERTTLTAHPWTLGSSAANELLQVLARNSTRLSQVVEEVGMTVFAGEDEAFFIEPSGPLSRLLSGYAIPVVAGDNVRDFQISRPDICVLPNGIYGMPRQLDPVLNIFFWPNRTVMRERIYFGKKIHERNLQWFDLSMLFEQRRKAALSIAFTAMETHPHFAVDRSNRLFRQTAPAIKLAEGSSTGAHLALTAILNSSSVAFWLRQNCHSYGSGASASGERKATLPWANYLDFATTRIKEIPIPDQVQPLPHCRLAMKAIADYSNLDLPIFDKSIPTRQLIESQRITFSDSRAEVMSAQEDLDWDVYQRYGLLSDNEAADVVWTGELVPIELGERAFEIILARQVALEQADAQWFARHGSTPITELPAHWPDDYRRTVAARIALIEKRRDLALIERPECKRRWATESWEKQQERALRTWLLDRLEARDHWFATDMNGQEQPAPQTVRSLADRVRGDADFVAVASLWAGDALGRPDAELAEIVGALVDDEHVPFHAAYRYKPSGLAKRSQWELTWSLQRQQDAIAERMGHDDVTHPEVREAIAKEIGDVPVPPKYGSGDFLRTSYWSQRGKLDVPKERFISYPAASRDGDGSLLLGWAGWDHREQAQALAVLIGQRRGEDGWPAERVQPLLAGLLELLPWVHQWHSEIDPVYGAAPGDIYDGFLDAQLDELQLSRQQIAEWRPDRRVDVAPLPRRAGPRQRNTDGAAPQPRRPRTAPDPAHLDAVLSAASSGPLSNEQIRDLTGLDAAGARAVTQHLVSEGRLVTSGQRRGMRYLLP